MMILLESIAALMLGVCFGSLNTLLIHRLPHHEPIGFSRSRCPVCTTALTGRDLIPLLSWLVTRGRCRYCKTSIHWRYPLTELLTAALFLLAYLSEGATLSGLFLALLASQIVVLIGIDIAHRIIPDSLQITMGLTGIAYGLATGIHPATMLGGALIGCLTGLALQHGFRLATGKDGLGTGDVKFLGVVGIWIGIPPLPVFLFYSGLLGVISAGLWRMIHDDPRFPFGPALALSLLLLLFYPPAVNIFITLADAVTSLFIAI